MKKIIIILMGITMMLVSCSTPSTVNDDENTYEEPIEPVETDVDYFMLEDGEDITDFEYKVMYNDVECYYTPYTKDVWDINIVNVGRICTMNINKIENKLVFSVSTKVQGNQIHSPLKVHNVTRNGNTVTIEIVDL